MMGYKDMTFCTFRGCKKHGSDCSRSYTEAVHKAAAQWWGGNDYPIILFLDKPDCYEDAHDSKKAQTNE